jgi:hypothetical protein
VKVIDAKDDLVEAYKSKRSFSEVCGRREDLRGWQIRGP